MKIKVSEANVLQLNWLVAFCENQTLGTEQYNVLVPLEEGQEQYSPSTILSQALEIIDRENIATSPRPDGLWKAYIPNGTRWIYKGNEPLEVFHWHYKAEGYSLLIAAMRCYVISKLGEEVEIPDELMV